MDNVVFRSNKPSEKASGSGGLIRGMINLSLVGLSLFLLYNIGRSVQIATLKLEILRKAEREVDELRIENVELILRKDTVQAQDYIETEARNRLNYSQDGEILFVISDPVMEQASVELEEILTGREDEGVITRETWEQWYDFFLLGV